MPFSFLVPLSVIQPEQGRVANPRQVAKIKTGRVFEPITNAAHVTGLGLQRDPVLHKLHAHNLIIVHCMCIAVQMQVQKDFRSPHMQGICQNLEDGGVGQSTGC